MSAPDDFGFLANDNLLSRETIEALCQEAGYKCRGLPLRNQDSESIVAWVKYGGDVEMAEALTQDWVAKFLATNPETGGRTAGGKGCPIFFMDWTSPIAYDTVEELQQHMNSILKHMGDTRRVDLVTDASAGLRLCPGDLNPGNFKNCRDGTVVALDFCATCFLPPSFFAVAVRKAIGSVGSWGNFAGKVAKLVDYPQSSDVEAMVSASYSLVPFERNDIGLPRGLHQRKRL